MESQEIMGVNNIPGYKDMNKCGVSSDNDEIDMVGILTLENGNIYIADTGGVSIMLTWSPNLDSDKLCSGLVIGIKGTREYDHGRFVGAVVNEYYFPESCRIAKPLPEKIYVCNSMNSVEKIDKIAENCGRLVYVLALSAGTELKKVLQHAKTKSNMFYIMPHMEHDPCPRRLPISFRIEIDNISSLEMPSIQNNILFVSETMATEMMSHTKLRTVADMLSLIAESGMVTPSNRILKRKNLGHEATLILCDTSDDSKRFRVGQTEIIMLSKRDILETNGIEHTIKQIM